MEPLQLSQNLRQLPQTGKTIKLRDRAEIANRNKADLFMSFHINAVEGSRSARGFQTWTLGRGASTGNKGIMENLDVAKRAPSGKDCQAYCT